MTLEEFEELVQEVDENGEGCTPYETKFLDDMLKNLRILNWRPSRPQVELLQKIAAERLT